MINLINIYFNKKTYFLSLLKRAIKIMIVRIPSYYFSTPIK